MTTEPVEDQRHDQAAHGIFALLSVVVRGDSRMRRRKYSTTIASRPPITGGHQLGDGHEQAPAPEPVGEMPRGRRSQQDPGEPDRQDGVLLEDGGVEVLAEGADRAAEQLDFE